jgi:hypothetical protein
MAEVLKTICFAAALSLGTALAAGQATAPPEPAAPPVAVTLEADAASALDAMAAYLRTLDRFSVRSDATIEVVDDAGQKLQFQAATTYVVSKPDRMTIELVSNDGTRREIFYNGKAMAVVGHATRRYVKFAVSGTVSEVLDNAADDYGIELPLRELFLWGTPGSNVERPTSGQKVGEAMIGTEMLDHYAFRQSGVDYQLWLTKGDKPLPRKLVITNLEVASQPQYVTYLRWDLEPRAKTSDFSFVPPTGYTLVDFGTAALADAATKGEK